MLLGVRRRLRSCFRVVGGGDKTGVDFGRWTLSNRAFLGDLQAVEERGTGPAVERTDWKPGPDWEW